MRLYVALFLNAALAHTLLDCGVHVAEGLTFGVIGDWGMGGFNAGLSEEIISTIRYTEACAQLKCNFTISVGDNFYCGRVEECIKYSFEQGMKDVPGPFFPIEGNHDNVHAQFRYGKVNPKWVYPSSYYTIKLPIDDTGYTVQIFAVNGNGMSLSDGAQYDWLRGELRKSNARWKIIFGHYPTTGSGRHKPERSVRKIHDLMTEFNAQAYFSGHDHIVEVNNINGRVLCISGGMSRGALLYRNKVGNTRRFSLTAPGEYSPYVQSWPVHGFMTVDLSPNTMNLNVWDSSGGVQYEFTVTHDWMQQVKNFPENMQHLWPPRDVILKALREELSLPRGPGGGTVFLAGGKRIVLPEETTDVPPTNLPPSERRTFTDVNTRKALDGEVSVPPLTTVPDFVQYAVSTECVECRGIPRVNKFFTLHISGIDVDSQRHRLFLAKTPAGCEYATRAPLSGIGVIMPSANTLRMIVTEAIKETYVCYSVNGGLSYSVLTRDDSMVLVYTFSVVPL